MDNREGVRTEGGFDWLYGEDADGAVVQEPPAIGAVTEPPRAPTAEASVRDLPADELVDELPDLVDDPFAALDVPAATEAFGPTPEAFPAHELEPAPVEAFGPGSETFPTQEPEPARADPTTAGPPPPPPPPPPPGEVPEDASETTVMSFVGAGTTAEIPVLSSRGDIIPEGHRKMSVRNRLTPAPRSRPAVTRAAAAPTQRRAGKRAVASALILLLAVAGTVWKSDALRERLFGGGPPSAEEIEAEFAALDGYAYQAIPQDQQAMLNSYERLMSEGFDFDFGIDLRVVARGDRPTGAVIVTSGDPDLLNTADAQAGFRDGMTSSGGRLDPETIAGAEAWVGAIPQAAGGTVVVFSDPDGFMVSVLAETEVDARDIASQLIEADL